MTIEFNFPEDSRGAVGTGESTLICGPVGVGKTTIQISVMVLLFLLSDVTLPIYIEYKEDENRNERLPYNVIHSFASHFQVINKQNTNSSTVLQHLYENKRMLVFFCDEIQTLYDNKSSTLSNLIVKQLAEIGKSAMHIGVASGSSRNLAAFAFHPKEYGFIGYRTLNNSVYADLHVIPSRTKGEFINIMRAVGEEQLSDVDLIAYFLNSGGVGRRINRGSKRLPEIPNEYYSNPVFRSIVDSMALQIKHGVQMGGAEIVWDPWKVSHAVPKSKCIEAAKKLVIATATNIDEAATKEFEKLLEFSLLLEINDQVELLLPGVLVSVLKSGQQHNNNNRFEQMAFEGTLVGWSENANSFASAGHCNEEPIRRMLAVSENKSYHQLEIKNDVLLSAEHHLDVWYQGVSNFPGIDGFLVENASENILEVSLSQIKTGKLTSEIKFGTIATKNTFRCFLNGMHLGYKKLQTMFSEADRPRLRLKRLVFLTTKLLDEKSVDFVNNPENLKIDGHQYEFQLWDSEAILDNLETEMDSIIINRLKNRM